jgi:hypothetical protein
MSHMVGLAHPTCFARFSPSPTFYIAASMAENSRKRKRGKNRVVEVGWDGTYENVVTYENEEYDTPAGRFTRCKEVPYKYAPPVSTSPKPSGSNVPMDEGPFDQEAEAPRMDPAEKRHKVCNSLNHTGSEQCTT